MKKKLHGFVARAVSNVCAVALITMSVVFAVTTPVSCKITESGMEVETGDVEAPRITDFSIASSSYATLACSKAFSLSDLALLRNDDGDRLAIGEAAVSFDESRTRANIAFPTETVIGKSYTLLGVVSDMSGNSLKFSKDFIGYNDNKARIILREVRPSYNNSAKKSAFLEFYALTGGNLVGTEVQFGYNNAAYSFPSVTVQKGETIVLHLKSYGGEADGYVNELDDNLARASAVETSEKARDLWVPEDKTYLSGTSDVIAVVDVYKNVATDGILYIGESGKSWSRNSQKSLAAFLMNSGVWASDSPESAVVTGMSSSATGKSIQRNNFSALVSSFSEHIPDCFSSSKSNWSISTSSVGE